MQPFASGVHILEARTTHTFCDLPSHDIPNTCQAFIRCGMRVGLAT